ncbi:MAG TPA: protein kinase, partial [Anaerolineae bacterium]|nr:protein kinase [Anaerolineae bacterium]
MTVCPNCKAQNRDTARFCCQCGAWLILGGEYRVVEVIKSGGMGTVYKAESGGRFYAVKEMRDTFTNPKERQDAINHFMAEALILARLSHPHIPKVHRHFIENDRYHLIMDFIEGQDLQAILDRRGGKGLPEEQVLSWAMQICAVLEYLHGQTPPVIFRDLKPANVMLRPDGDVSLIDFGIAKLFNPARQGTLIGTPGYAAPEQYQGLAEPRSDIFALGATLHHLLTGRDPKKHLPFTFPLLRSLNPATLSVDMES